MEYNQEASDSISLLRQVIKDRNKDIHLAATVGKELLQKTDKLSEKLETVQSENEILRQEKYSLQLDLETKVQTVNTQSCELELQREQYDSVVKQLEVLRKESITQKQQINNFKRENLDFEKAQEDLQRENHSLKKKIDSLEHQVQGLQLKVEASVYLGVVDEESDKEFDANYYKCQNKQLSEALSELQCDLESAKLSENRLANMVKELEEGVYDRDKELAAYSVEIQRAKDYATELQGELEILKLEQVDVNRRGNSVFGEIDDRRKLIEKEYKLLIKRYENLGKRFQTMKKELLSSKGQMAILFSMTSRSHQDAYIEKLEDQLGSAKREVESLTTKLSMIIKSMQQSRQEQVFTGSDEYGYLRVMNEQSENKIKQLENDLITVHMQKIADNDELLRTRQEQYAVQVELDTATIEIMKLQHKIKELTLTIEPPEVSAVDEAGIVVREFDPNKIAAPKPEPNPDTLLEEVNEKESSKTMGTTCGQADIYEIHPIPSKRLPSRPVLYDLNETLTKDEACENAVNSSKEKTKKADHFAYLDSTPYKQNCRTFSNCKDRKHGQCAQQ